MREGGEGRRNDMMMMKCCITIQMDERVECLIIQEAGSDHCLGLVTVLYSVEGEC